MYLGDLGQSLGQEDFLKKVIKPLQYFLPGESPLDRKSGGLQSHSVAKKLDTTECLFHFL